MKEKINFYIYSPSIHIDMLMRVYMHLLVLWYLDWVILIKIMSSYLLHINSTKDPPYYNIKELSTLSIL